MSGLKKDFDGKKIAVVAISVDSAEDSTALAARLNITIPLLSDPDLAVIKAYGVAMEGNDIAVPSTFIVGSDRVVRWRHVGETQFDRPDSQQVLELTGQ